MTYVVTEPCIKCRNTECVAVCPADCFHVGGNMLVINPDGCIDCGACEPVCPTSAIYAEDDVPKKWAEYTTVNSTYAAEWPVISERRDALQDAEERKTVDRK
ncbi:ferredoxin family protein [Embleya sp. NBC_00896]|uniref:ferredoxin family protein n=1 Tax=Embleya sp. NBC_00896 TaxID=2975961 RepID=UPI002F90A9CE|nr:ferredoxin family protein [Embleya sp. NBC_00896]